MLIVTKAVFKKQIMIVSIIFAILLVSNSYAQLKMELNFGEEDNFIATKKSVGSSLSVSGFTNQLITHGNYLITIPPHASPSGGHCLELNGIDQYIMLPAAADIQMTGNLAFSVSMWIQAETSVRHGDIVNSDNGFISGYRLYLEDRQLKLEIREEKKEIFTLDSLLNESDWMHIGFICDGAGDSMSFYLNGSPVQTKPFTIVSQVVTGGFTSIGGAIRNPQPDFLKARIDGFRFFAGFDTVFENIRKIISSRETLFSRKNRRIAELPFELNQNYPNPFNASTKISYSLKKEGLVTLKIYDLLGNRVTILFEGEQTAGFYEFFWNGTDSHEKPVPSGIYMIRLEFNQWVLTRKMVLVK